MGKNRIKKMSQNERAEFEKLEEERKPNHWSYNDDPMLNIEPIFTDQPSTKLEVDEVFVEEPTIQEKEKQTSTFEKSIVTGGELGSIISNARKISETIQNDVLEKDPVIAKLAKIEELKRTGGSSDEVYTDTSKSNGRSAYAKRAEEFHRQNLKKVNIETELERRLRLQSEAQQKRDLQRGIIEEQVNKPKVDIEEEKDSPENHPFLAIRRGIKNDLDDLENEIKNYIQEIKIIKQNKIEREALATIIEIENKEFNSEIERREFLEKRLDQLKIFKMRMELKLKTKTLPSDKGQNKNKKSKKITANSKAFLERKNKKN